MIKINLNPTIPPLKRYDDKRKVDVRYVLISPYASAHIFWDDVSKELVYEVCHRRKNSGNHFYLMAEKEVELY